MVPPSDRLADNEKICNRKEHVNIELAMHPRSASGYVIHSLVKIR
jgi:hypothetical protein